MPADFAAGHGKTYPLGVLPEAMPLPATGKTTKVPDILNCTSWQQCNSVLSDHGLLSQQNIAKNLDPSVFKVLSVSPEPGRDIPEGSVVMVTTRPAKVLLRPSWVFKQTMPPVFRSTRT
jgi:hypothetical protein